MRLPKESCSLDLPNLPGTRCPLDLPLRKLHLPRPSCPLGSSALQPLAVSDGHHAELDGRWAIPAAQPGPGWWPPGASPRAMASGSAKVQGGLRVSAPKILVYMDNPIIRIAR